MWTADSDHWDIDRDGVDETADAIYGPGNPWDLGLIIGEQRLRAALPNAILVANGDRTLHGGLLDGRVFESFMDQAADRDHADDLETYLASASGNGGRSPRVTMTINKTARNRVRRPPSARRDSSWSPRCCRTASGRRWERTTGYSSTTTRWTAPDWAVATSVSHLKRTRRWPRCPNGGNPAQDRPADGVYRRDFEHGIVLINTSAQSVTIPLERTYTKLKGTQDPVTNDGAQVDSVTIAPQDAIVLLR